jgi:hypothetical protein
MLTGLIKKLEVNKMGASSIRGTCLNAPCGPALRRGLDSFGASYFSRLAPLPTRFSFPPILDRVGFQYVNHDITSIAKLLLVDPFRFSRVWLSLVHFHSFVVTLYSLIGFKCNSKGTQKNGNFTRKNGAKANV